MSTGLSIKAMIWSYTVLAVGLFVYLYVPLLASNQFLDATSVWSLVSESPLPLKREEGSNPDNRQIVAIVTGSTNGIGRELAAQLYSLGLTVVVASRNGQKCDNVIQEIKSEYSQSKGALEAGIIDTGDLNSVSAFARKFISSHSKLHFLVLNAGIHYASTEIGGKLAMDPSVQAISPQGFDLAFATNYLGHFLLAKMLQPLLESSGPGTRLINVASSYHMQSDGTALLATSDKDKDKWPLAARSDTPSSAHRHDSYSNNKLAQVLHAKEIQRRLDAVTRTRTGTGTGTPAGLLALSFCPGWVDTGIIPNNVGGNTLRKLAFNPKAATIGLIGGLFSQRLSGGEFISIFKNVITTQSWAKEFFKTVTRWGIRGPMTHMLAAVILFTQGASYGFTVAPTSPEAEDERLARELFDWSDRVVTPFI